MTLTLIDRTRRTDDATDRGVAPEAAPEPATGPATAQAPGAAPRRAAGREADGLAVASFVLGLVGLLAFNLLLGPTAIVMALLSLARRTRRPGRACLGLALGIADLVVLAVLVTVNGTVAWNFGV
ncbi:MULTISPECIES: hypothetical protein [Streptomyces]|uniref:hypothetical protein n=1 Tax=Streptomyces TaxID=1883 RepID=UPI000D508CAC|nr:MULTISPECIES: hypothetical protein [Streptomyces]MXG25315.1 hypothetical protein [Streptomyces sp. YIM 132580]PVC75304.1 hypothetical protein DBP15_07750 [Streptomyces sp. CS065A]